MKNLIRILSLSLLLLFLATSCNMLDEILGDGGDYGDLRVQYLVANYQNGTVQLSWDIIDGADSYEIWFSENEYNNYNHVDTVYGNFYTHNYGFQSDRYYYYKIRIMDYNGTLHDYSNHVFVYIDYGGSDTVENLYVYMDGNSAAISWNQHNNAQEYELEYKMGEFGNYMYLTTLDEWTTSFYHYNINSSTYYYYRIRYRDFNGNWSNYSEEVSVYSGDDHGGGGNIINNLYVEMDGSSAYITWDQHYDAQQYEIEYSYNEYEYMYLTTIYDNYSTWFYHYDLEPHTYYYYRIRYLDYNGNWSDFTNPFPIYTGNIAGSGVTGIYGYYDYGYVYLDWDYHNDADYYEVWASDTYDGEYIHLGDTYGEYFTDSAAPPYAYRYYKVRYIDYNGNPGAFSDYYSVYVSSVPYSYVYADEGYSGYLDNGYVEWLVLEGYGGSVILTELNDADSGDQSYYGDVRFTLYHDDMTTPYAGFEDVDSTDEGVFIEIPYDEYELYIKVTSEYSGYYYINFLEASLDNIARLDTLTLNIDAGTISQPFDPYVTDYYISASPESSYIDFYGIVTESFLASAVYTVDGVEYDFDDSFNIDLNNFPDGVDITISVTSSDGSTTLNYNFYVSTGSDNNNLSSLIFSSGTIPFDSANVDYLLSVGNEVDVIYVTPTAEDVGATIFVNDVEVVSGETSGPISVGLANNVDLIIIDVHAPNGSVKTYSLDVNRETADLDNFIVYGAVNIEYDEFEDSYYVGLETGVSSVDIEVIALDPTAVITIEGEVTGNKTINLSGDYNVRTFTMEIDPNDGLGDSRFIDVYIVPSWTNDNPGGESALYYSFPSTLFDEYMVQWDDKVNGSGRYYEDIIITALYEDNSTVYGELDRVNSGFHSPVTLTADEDGIIILKVEALDGGILEDEFALRVYNVTTDTWVPFLVSGDNTIVIE